MYHKKVIVATFFCNFAANFNKICYGIYSMVKRFVYHD